MLQTKEEKDHPDYYQQQVQKPGSVMVWGCVSALGKGNLHFCDGTINAEKYIEILEHNMLPSEDIFSRDVHAYFNKTMQNHILHTLQSPGCGGRGYGYLTGLPALNIFLYMGNISASAYEYNRAVKGIVQPKIKIKIKINYSPSCRSKPVRSSEHKLRYF